MSQLLCVYICISIYVFLRTVHNFRALWCAVPLLSSVPFSFPAPDWKGLCLHCLLCCADSFWLCFLAPDRQQPRPWQQSAVPHVFAAAPSVSACGETETWPREEWCFEIQTSAMAGCSNGVSIEYCSLENCMESVFSCFSFLYQRSSLYQRSAWSLHRAGNWLVKVQPEDSSYRGANS